MKHVPLYAPGDRWFYRTVRIVSGLTLCATYRLSCEGAANLPATIARTLKEVNADGVNGDTIQGIPKLIDWCLPLRLLARPVRLRNQR